MAIQCAFRVVCAVCLTALVGCRLTQHRAAAKLPQNPAVVADQVTPPEEMALGLASYDQLVAEPNSTLWGKSPYHFGRGGQSTSAMDNAGFGGSSRRT